MAPTALQHEALFYADEDDFLAGTVPFIRDGLEADEPVLAVVAAWKIDPLRAVLGSDADGVEFADMAEVGQNPARIIPAWRSFVDAHADKGCRLRGIGEPIWAERTPDEIVECQRHEDLLNVAFADGPSWRLLCPYDTTALDPAVIEEARRSHHFIVDGGAMQPSTDYRGLDAITAPFDRLLPDPPTTSEHLGFDATHLSAVRQLVGGRAAAFGMDEAQVDDAVLAVSELATNSVRHGGGNGVLHLWTDGDVLICEVRDRGFLTDPLADRTLVDPGKPGGRGLWIANGVCDLLQLRSSPQGTTARMHLRRR